MHRNAARVTSLFIRRRGLFVIDTCSSLSRVLYSVVRLRNERVSIGGGRKKNKIVAIRLRKIIHRLHRSERD